MLPVTDDRRLIALYSQDQRRRGLLASTIDGRSDHLRSFLIEFPQGFGAVTGEEIQVMLDKRRGTKNKGGIDPRTRSWWLSCLHNFYAWAIDTGYLDHDPTAKIQRPRVRRTLPRPMHDPDLQRAITNADAKKRCWLLLGACQGLRCQEIAGLNREDVIETDGLLRVVHGKGQHERLLPLHPDVLAALEALPMPSDGALFRRERMLNRYPPAQLVKELNKYLRSQGITSTAHSLRHWFGTKLYQDTHDLRLTQEMLGHESPQTTAPMCHSAAS
jgi:site-specific recombinase XerD